MFSFVFSNPGHHAEILLPAVRALQERGRRCEVLSLAEFRGMTTPRWELQGVRVKRVIPVRRPGRIPPPKADEVGARGSLRSRAQKLVWTGILEPRLRWLLRASQVVVVPNDAAYPYAELCRWLRNRGTPFVLVQEGIRFRLPIEDAVPYGKAGAARVCVWGQGSADYFASRGVPHEQIAITGNPRFDRIDLAHWQTEGAAFLARHQIPAPPVLYMSNPIDAQGFGSQEFKLQLFEAFLREAQVTLERANAPLVIKLHSYEDPSAFRAILQRFGVRAVVAEAVPLFALLAVARAAIVAASTVGLEALFFGVPLGALHLGDHGYAFEYVARAAAEPLEMGRFGPGLEALLRPTDERKASGRLLVERHLANVGTASVHVADAIEGVMEAR